MFDCNKNNRKPVKKYRKEALGFTLIEVLISTSIFAVIILSITSLFKLSIDSQREAMAVQNTQESLKYFLEMTAKEIRMAQRDGAVCLNVEDDKVFAVTQSQNSDTLHFKNYYGECVSYYLSSDSNGVNRFVVRRYTPPGATAGRDLIGYISPETINIDRLSFVARDNLPGKQPMVTINVRAAAVGEENEESQIILQTSVSSRYYKE